MSAEFVDINDLKEERAREFHRVEEIRAAAAKEDNRPLTEEEDKEVSERMDTTDTLSKEIETRERLEAQKALVEAPAVRKTPEPDPRRKRPPAEVAIAADKGDHGFKRGFGEFCMSVRGAYSGGAGARTDVRLTEHRAPTTYGQTGVGADGGFLVPPDFRDVLMQKVFSEDSLIGRCDQLTTGANQITVPLDEDTPWSTSGIRPYWEGENAQMTQSKPLLKQNQIRLHKMTVLIPVTEELAEDAFALDTYITRKASEKMRFQADLAIVSGSGAGKPLGFRDASCTVSVTKEGSQVADTVNFDNLAKMYNAMYAPSRVNAVWVMNQDVEPELLRLFAQTSVGTALTDIMVYMPPGGISQSPYATLYGRPVIPHQAMETLGDKGDIAFVDLTQYLLLQKTGGMRTETSIHLWFDYDTSAFRIVWRLGGQPWWGSTIAARDGSATYSPFVVLAERT